MAALYHLGIIEGWCIAQDAPPVIFEAARLIRTALEQEGAAAPASSNPEEKTDMTAETMPADSFPEGSKKVKRTNNWSPEMRAAQGERMRLRWKPCLRPPKTIRCTLRRGNSAHSVVRKTEAQASSNRGRRSQSSGVYCSGRCHEMPGVILGGDEGV